jgi:hypothetical protein
MKRLTIAALIGGQLLTVAPPAMAAGLTDGGNPQMGTFGGLRVRVPLDGHANRQPVRAGLTLAPTMHTRTPDGERRTLIGEGLELGFNGNRPLTLSLAGTPVHRLGAAQNEPEGQEPQEAEEEEEGDGPSTLGWIAIGVGGLLVVTAGLGYLAVSEILDCDPGEEC